MTLMPISIKTWLNGHDGKQNSYGFLIFALLQTVAEENDGRTQAMHWRPADYSKYCQIYQLYVKPFFFFLATICCSSVLPFLPTWVFFGLGLRVWSFRGLWSFLRQVWQLGNVHGCVFILWITAKTQKICQWQKKRLFIDCLGQI